MKPNYVDQLSYIFAGFIFLFGLLLFFSQTNEFFKSFTAALIAGALAWVSYVLVRWLFLALRK